MNMGCRDCRRSSKRHFIGKIWYLKISKLESGLENDWKSKVFELQESEPLRSYLWTALRLSKPSKQHENRLLFLLNISAAFWLVFLLCVHTSKLRARDLPSWSRGILEGAKSRVFWCLCWHREGAKMAGDRAVWLIACPLHIARLRFARHSRSARHMTISSRISGWKTEAGFACIIGPAPKGSSE